MKFRVNHLNGWRRIWFIITVIYLLCISTFIIINETYEKLAMNMINKWYNAAKERVENSRVSMRQSARQSVSSDGHQSSLDLNSLSDQLTQRDHDDFSWLPHPPTENEDRNEFTKIEKILESIRHNKELGLYREALDAIKRLELNPVDSANLLEVATILEEYPDAIRHGEYISVPPEIYWEWIRRRNPVTTSYISDPSSMGSVRNILKEEENRVKSFASNPRNFPITILIYVISIAAIIIIYIILPLAVLYYGGKVSAKKVKWVIMGFAKSSKG